MQKQCKDIKLFIIQLIIVFIGVIACTVSKMFFAQKPALYEVCFDVGVVILIFCLSTFLKTNHSARGIWKSYIFALIPYMIFMIFFRKSTVVTGVVTALLTAIILFIIHLIRENKFCESYLEYIVENAEKFVNTYDDMVDNVHSMYDAMRTLYNNVNEPFCIELGEMDDIEYYDMPECPCEVYYSYNMLYRHMWGVNRFIYQVANLMEELERKLDIMKAEIGYRQNQYKSIRLFDEICAGIDSDEIKQLFKDKLPDFKKDISYAFIKNDKPLMSCLEHKVKFTKYKEQSPNNRKIKMHANRILTEWAQYGLIHYGETKDISNRYAKIAVENPGVAIDTAKNLLYFGRNKLSDAVAYMHEKKNKKYIEDTQNYIAEVHDKTNRQIEALTAYRSKIEQLVQNKELTTVEVSENINSLTNDYIEALNNIA